MRRFVANELFTALVEASLLDFGCHIFISLYVFLPFDALHLLICLVRGIIFFRICHFRMDIGSVQYGLENLCNRHYFAPL